MNVKISIENKVLNTIGEHYESGLLHSIRIKCNEEEYREIIGAINKGIEIVIEAESKKYLMGTHVVYHYLANELEVYPKGLSSFL